MVVTDASKTGYAPVLFMIYLTIIGTIMQIPVLKP